MAIYGFGAMFGGDTDVTDEFLQQGMACVGWSEQDAPPLFDMLRNIGGVGGLKELVDDTLRLVRLAERADLPVSELAYGEKRRLEIGLALATAPTLLLTGSDSVPSVVEATRLAAATLPRAQVQVLDGHAHFAHRTDPPMVATILRRFIAS